MNASQLKELYYEHNPNDHFFDRETMKFFGDTMKNYGVRKAKIKTRDGMKDVYELFRRNPVKHGFQDSAYFDMETFDVVLEAK